MAGSGSLSHEAEMFVPASKAWELYGTIKLAKLIEERMPENVTGIEILEGDGGAGTVLKLNLAPGLPFTHYNEKFTVVDDEKRVKVVEMVEGGFLAIGFTLYRMRLEIIEKGSESSIVKSTIEYEAKGEAASTASSVITLHQLVAISQLAKEYLATK